MQSNVSDVDLKNLTIQANAAKRGKDGICLINNDCASTLRRYLDARPPYVINGLEHLFYADYGQRWQRTEVHRLFTHSRHVFIFEAYCP
jgi:hypothetical protein